MIESQEDEDLSDCPPSKEEVEMLEVHCVEKIIRSTRRWAKNWTQSIQMMDAYFDQYFKA